MKQSSEYHSETYLSEIQNIDSRNTFQLIQTLKDGWCYDNFLKEKWIFKEKKPILILELHTGGMSSNEDIIDALQNNRLFWLLWWWKSERGGHFYFEIDFSVIGFKLVSQYCKEKNVSRQYIWTAKDKFEWIEISSNKKLIRPLTINS